MVFHEFATGTERPLAAVTTAMAATAPVIDRFGSETVQGKYLIFRTLGPARLHLLDVTTGTGSALPVPDDLDIDNPPRLSPDGRTVALVARKTSAGKIRYQVITVDVATGRVAPPQEITTVDELTFGHGILGLAFSDNHTVRVARYAFPADADRVYEISQLLKVSTFTV